MNTKKAVWLNKPEKIKATLHSLSFRSESAHSVFFILGEEGEMTLRSKASIATAFVLFHTKEDYIVFSSQSIILSFSGIRTEIPHSPVNNVTLIKKGSLLTFKNGEDTLLTITKKAFSTSTSFGLSAKGEGEVELEVF